MHLWALLTTGRGRVLDEPPANAQWRYVRPKALQKPVRARRAEADTRIDGPHGVLHARGGVDYIVVHAPGDQAVVRGEIFARTYEPLGGGLYRKRSDVVLRYFVLDHPAPIRTLEGVVKAKRGDWVMQGVTGELWPLSSQRGREKYDPA